MYKNTVGFVCGNFNYLIEEIQTSPRVVKLLVTATHDNGKVYHRDPVYAVGDDVYEALYKAYTRLATNTVIINDTQLQFMMRIANILEFLYEVDAEIPV